MRGLTFSVLATGAILLLIGPSYAQTDRDHRDNPKPVTIAMAVRIVRKVA